MLIKVSFRGKVHEFELSGALTVGDLRAKIHHELGIEPDDQKLIVQGRTLTPPMLLSSLGTPSDVAKVMLVGAARHDIDAFKQEEREKLKEIYIRAHRSEISLAGRVDKEAALSPYKFEAIQVLPGLPDGERARSMLQELATDRGILAVMRAHRWTVGVLAELYPEGQVGGQVRCAQCAVNDRG
jgi:hypothetical protein